jgi:hypothetical protein
MPLKNMKTSVALLCLLGVAYVESSCSARVTCGSTVPLRVGTLLQTNFETGAGWGKVAPTAVGTIDLAGSTQPSRGLHSNALISSGPLSIKNSETNLGKLTLAFSLSASAARPVRVLVESFNARKQRTGGLETFVYPAASNFYQRYALDLSTFKPSGGGKFVPNAPFIGFSLSIGGVNWGDIAQREIRIDNVQFAKPAYYVSANGNDNNDGRTEQTAFATPRKAVELAGPGDIIAVMNGTYLPVGIQEGIVRFKRAGTPAGWISLRNYPGHKPQFFVKGAWTAIRIWQTQAEATAIRMRVLWLLCRLTSKCAVCTFVAKVTWPEKSIRS